MCAQVVEDGDADRHRLDVAVERAAVVDLLDAIARGIARAAEDAHHGVGAGDDAERQARTDDLAVDRQVGGHTVVGLGPARREAEARDDLVDQQQHTAGRADAPQFPEEVGVDGDGAARPLDRLDHHHREPVTVLANEAEGRLVVVGQHERVRRVLGRDADRVADEPRTLLGPGLRRVVDDRPEHLVVPAVVSALELRDAEAAGDPSRDADGVQRRLGSRVAEGDLAEVRRGLEDEFREFGFANVRRAEAGAVEGARAQGLGDDRVRMAEQLRSESQGAVDVRVAVGVVEACPLAPRGDEGKRWQQPCPAHRARGDDLARTRVQRLGARAHAAQGFEQRRGGGRHGSLSRRGATGRR